MLILPKIVDWQLAKPACLFVTLASTRQDLPSFVLTSACRLFFQGFLQLSVNIDSHAAICFLGSTDDRSSKNPHL